MKNYLIIIEQIGRLLRITANNVNQLAKRVNSGGEAYRQDVAKVNEQLTEIRKDFGKLLSVLSDVVSPKPDKRFIPPPRISDGDYPEITTVEYEKDNCERLLGINKNAPQHIAERKHKSREK